METSLEEDLGRFEKDARVNTYKASRRSIYRTHFSAFLKLADPTSHVTPDKNHLQKWVPNGAAGLASHQATSLRHKLPLLLRLAFLMQ